MSASRMIITLPERQRLALRAEAGRLGIPVAELVRRCLDAQLASPGGLGAAKDAWLSLVGLGEGDGAPVGRRHREALRESLRGRPGRGRLR